MRDDLLDALLLEAALTEQGLSTTEDRELQFVMYRAFFRNASKRMHEATAGRNASKPMHEARYGN